MYTQYSQGRFYGFRLSSYKALFIGLTFCDFDKTFLVN